MHDERLTMKEQQAKEKLSQWVDIAKSKGAKHCDAVLSDGQSWSVNIRHSKIEQIQFSEGIRGALRVFIGKKTASVSTHKLDYKSLEQSATQAVEMAKILPEDEFAGLPEESLLIKQSELKTDLNLFDNRDIDKSDLIECAKICEDSALSIKGITNSYGSGANSGNSRFYLCSSQGFFGGIEKSHYSLYTSVLAENKDGTQVVDGEEHSTLFFNDLNSPEYIGRLAGKKTVRELNPRTIKTTSVPVIFDYEIANSILSHFIDAISGVEIAMGSSFLKKQMNKKIFKSNITIIDDPLRKKGLASSLFDSEGVKRKKIGLVEDGILKSWILDSRSARQLNLRSTGHASRGMGTPLPCPTNCYIKPGTESPEQMIKNIDKGFYVTNFLGSSINLITGDYSRGARGLWIEKGELSYAVSEVTIAGTLQNMFNNMTPANNLKFRYGLDSPTLRIDGLTIAGK
jgi:PmbA protein